MLLRGGGLKRTRTQPYSRAANKIKVEDDNAKYKTWKIQFQQIKFVCECVCVCIVAHSLQSIQPKYIYEHPHFFHQLKNEKVERWKVWEKERERETDRVYGRKELGNIQQQQYSRLNNIYETAKLKIFAELFRMLSVHVVISLIYCIGSLRESLRSSTVTESRKYCCKERGLVPNIMNAIKIHYTQTAPQHNATPCAPALMLSLSLAEASSLHSFLAVVVCFWIDKYDFLPIAGVFFVFFCYLASLSLCNNSYFLIIQHDEHETHIQERLVLLERDIVLIKSYGQWYYSGNILCYPHIYLEFVEEHTHSHNNNNMSTPCEWTCVCAPLSFYLSSFHPHETVLCDICSV